MRPYYMFYGPVSLFNKCGRGAGAMKSGLLALFSAVSGHIWFIGSNPMLTKKRALIMF